MSAEGEPASKDLRSEIGKQLEGKFTPEQLKLLIDEILSIRKKTSFDTECKKCGQKQRFYGEVSDAKGVSAALKDLMGEAFGRPQEVSVEPVFQVVRNVYVVADQDEPKEGVAGGIQA